MEISGQAIFRALLLVGIVASIQVVLSAENKQINNQPLANLNAIVRQLGSLDNKAIANVTSALEQVANNMRRMLDDNARIQNDVRNFFQIVQNTTGVNITETAKDMQRQSLNTTSLSNFLPRASRSAI